MKKALIIIIVIILLGGIGYYTYTMLNKEKPKSEKTVEVMKDPLLVYKCIDKSSSLCGINEDGKVKYLNNIDNVLSIDGAGGRSFDVYKETLYYLDTSYVLHIQNFKNKTEDTVELGDKLKAKDYLDVYAGDGYVLMNDEGVGYIYSIDEDTLTQTAIKQDRVAGYNYFNRNNNTFYYTNGDSLFAYNVVTKNNANISGNYKVYGISEKYSNDDNLIFSVDSTYYAYNYNTQKINKVLDNAMADDTIIKFDGNIVVYTHQGNILSKSSAKELTVEKDFELPNDGYIDYSGISTNKFALIGVYVVKCSNGEYGGTCGGLLSNVYRYNYKDGSLTDLSEEYSDVYNLIHDSEYVLYR